MTLALRILAAVWKPLSVLALVCAIYAAGYMKAAGVAKARSREAQLETRIAELTRDLDAGRVADAYEQLAISHLQAERDALAAERETYLAAAEKEHPGDACPYSPGDVERLRKLRGLKAAAGGAAGRSAPP